ncbi:hypothetical protein Tco_0242794 [Tanacetum coccineum]
MAAPVISISSDTSEESMGSHAPRVILFGAIPVIIPVIPEVPVVPADPIVTPEAGRYSEPAEQRPVSSSHDALTIIRVSPCTYSSSSSALSDHSLSGHTPQDTTMLDSSTHERLLCKITLQGLPLHSEAFRTLRSQPLNGYSKRKPKTTKLSTGWKRQSQSKAKRPVSSQEHQSSTPHKEKPESSTTQKTDTSYSESYSCSKTFKPYENYMPITKRQLVRNIQHISEVLYAQVVKDHWEKHEEATASYANLK